MGKRRLAALVAAVILSVAGLGGASIRDSHSTEHVVACVKECLWDGPPGTTP